MAEKKIIDVWSDDEVCVFAAFALNYDNSVKEMLAGSESAFNIVRRLMLDKHSNSLIRERVNAKLEDYDHSCKMHDYDAFNKFRLKDVEIKNEQHSTLDPRRNQIVGGAAFSSIEDIAGINRLIYDNPEICLSGWYDGRIAYTTTFDFNDTLISTRLISAIESRRAGKKTAPKFLWSDWADADSLRLTYINQEIFSKLKGIVSAPLLERIESAKSRLTPENISLQDPCSDLSSKNYPSLQNTNLCTEYNDRTGILTLQERQPTCLSEIS